MRTYTHARGELDSLAPRGAYSTLICRRGPKSILFEPLPPPEPSSMSTVWTGPNPTGSLTQTSDQGVSLVAWAERLPSLKPWIGVWSEPSFPPSQAERSIATRSPSGRESDPPTRGRGLR